MKLRMKSTQRGSVDGVKVETYEVGKEYDLGDSGGARDLARVFIAQGWAEEAKAVPVAPENKALGIDAATKPQNKAADDTAARRWRRGRE